MRDYVRYHPDISKLLGALERLRKTTRWVMQRVILGQIRGAKGVLYGLYLSLFLALD
jgi:hypothetical protein